MNKERRINIRVSAATFTKWDDARHAAKTSWQTLFVGLFEAWLMRQTAQIDPDDEEQQFLSRLSNVLEECKQSVSEEARIMRTLTALHEQNPESFLGVLDTYKKMLSTDTPQT